MPARRSSRDAAPAGDTLRRAREAAGLSLREASALTGLSPATVREAEASGDPRLSTLEAWLQALPSLAPEALLGLPPARPRASAAAFRGMARAFGLSIDVLRFEVRIAADGSRVTRLEARGIRSERHDARTPEGRRALAQLAFRGSPEARLALAAELGEDASRATVADGCFRHALRFPARGLATWTREQTPGAEPPPGFARPGFPSLSAPFREGVSIALEHPVRRLEIAVVVAEGALPEAARWHAWSDLQTVASDGADLAARLDPAAVAVRRLPRRRMLLAVVHHPELGLHHGLGWDAGAPPALGSPTPAPRDRGEALRASRARAGLTVRGLAARARVSPATVLAAEAGADLRLSLARGLAEALGGVDPEVLLRAPPSSRPLAPRELWERQRLLLGVESQGEAKTLVVTPGGDAHALIETRELARVHPSDRDLRIRYPSAQAVGRRLPTELRSIEAAVAAEAEGAGLRARVVARQQGRLIHEIVVPAALARRGVSFTRRLFDAGFYDPARAGETAAWDGAALVPFHATRRVRLVVRFASGAFPAEAVFGVHPRMMLDAPLPEADLAATAHPEGVRALVDARRRTLSLEADFPLVGLMYDVFWRRRG